MALKIKSGSFLTQSVLTVKDEGCVFTESGSDSGKFGFNEIAAILMSPSNLLSIYVGPNIYSVQMDMEDLAHKDALNLLLAQVQRPRP